MPRLLAVPLDAGDVFLMAFIILQDSLWYLLPQVPIKIILSHVNLRVLKPSRLARLASSPYYMLATSVEYTESDLNAPTRKYGCFDSHGGIGPRSVGTVFMKETEIHKSTAKWCNMKF